MRKEKENEAVEAEPNDTYQAFVEFAQENQIDNMEQAFDAFVGRTIQRIKDAKKE